MGSIPARLLYPLRGRLERVLGPGLPRFWNPTGRLHILPGLSFADFAARLNERSLDYVVLNCGVRDEGEFELLVRGDDDYDRLLDLVTEWPVGTPLSVYTVSPRPHTAYYSPLIERVTCNRIAVFPPYISVQLLDRSAPDGHGTRVLTAHDAFFACAYRAAYMEAVCCDWGNIEGRCKRCSAYEARVRQLASVARIALPEPLTPQSLDQLLYANGWRPPLDLLEKAVRWAPWIRYAFPELEWGDEESRTPGVAVFFLRELAFRNGWKDRVLATLVENGFELILVKDLDEQERDRAARWFRGGDWGALRLRVSAGPPVSIIIALDCLPQPVAREWRARHPDADNQRTITAKYATRNLLKASLPPEEAYNPLHSTDNSGQAWTAVRLLLPDQEQELRAKVRERRGATAMNGHAHPLGNAAASIPAGSASADARWLARELGRRVVPKRIRAMLRSASRKQTRFHQDVAGAP